MATTSSLSNTFTLFFIIITSLIIILSSSRAVAASGDLMGWAAPTARSGCRGTIAECLSTDEEFDLDSEATRRILATTRYISYGALQRNTVPCSRRGASYYNCRSGAQANPYSRGCSAITRCRR
ncbi:hypothetical protein ACSBR2_005400 [Camellia fascicularis]